MSVEMISLPPPVTSGSVSLEEAIHRRISRREFQEKSLELFQAGQLLWSAGGLGITGAAGVSRAAPSAGATYPLELYLAAGEVKGLGKGLYRYEYRDHALEVIGRDDLRAGLARASLGQAMIARAAATIIIAAHFERTTRRYGKRGYRYVYMEAGYVSENIYLQAEALGLATVAVGAFKDGGVNKLTALEGTPLLLMPVGLR